MKEARITCRLPQYMSTLRSYWFLIINNRKCLFMIRTQFHYEILVVILKSEIFNRYNEQMGPISNLIRKILQSEIADRETRVPSTEIFLSPLLSNIVFNKPDW
jgi:hypothetical protein